MLRSRGRARNLARVVVVVGSPLVICFYVFAALVAAGAPPSSQFPGWIAIVATPAVATADQVAIEVSPLVPGGPGTHPAVQYQIVACGPLPFDGELLTGGAARLEAARVLDPFANAGTPEQPATERALSGSISDIASRQTQYFGPAEALALKTSNVVACASTQSGTVPIVTGTPWIFQGELRQPVRRKYSLLGAHGPLHSQSWPLVGEFPVFAPSDLGAFVIGGLGGQWIRPTQLLVKVTVGSLALKGSVENSRPQLTDPATLEWQGPTPFAPFARIIDLNDQGFWQTVLVAASIGLGVAAAWVAAVLLRLSEAPPPASDLPPVVPTGLDVPERPAAVRRSTSARNVGLIVAAFAVGRATRRRRNRVPE